MTSSMNRRPFVPPKWLVHCVLAVCLGVTLSKSVAAQTGQTSVPSHLMETQDQIPPDALPVPQKLTGVGNSHIKISASADSQMWFDQGLNLLHDFWDYESAKAFEQAVRLDPNCAMCYWGLYKAESFYHGTAQGYAGAALAKAASLSRHASKHERLYIAMSVAYEDALKAYNSGAGGDFSKFRQLMRRLANDDPKDTQARIFLAWSLQDGFDSSGEPLAGQKEAIAILQAVLRDDPLNSAANHYYVHFLEAGAHPELALHNAEILPGLAPDSGHMVHMPGHIFFRTGDYAKAEQAFDASMRVDETYMDAQHVEPDYDWNYVHNLMYAIANLMEEGKLSEATALSSKLSGARGKLESTLYIRQPRDSISRVDPRLPVALRIGNWSQVSELSKAAAPPDTQPNLRFLACELAELAEGMRAVEAHDFSKAEASSARVDAELWRISHQPNIPGGVPATTSSGGTPNSPKSQINPDALLDPIVGNLTIMSFELRASMLMAQGNLPTAKSLFAQAAQKESELGYREPPGYIRPVAESEAAALAAAGDWTGAKSSYEKALSQRPGSGFSLFGIAMVNEKSGDSAGAVKGYADFLAAWKNADPALNQVTHARSYLAEHQTVAGRPQ